MVTQVDPPNKHTSTTATAQTKPMAINIQNVSKQYNNQTWGLRDFMLQIGNWSDNNEESCRCKSSRSNLLAMT